ncbi:MAG: Flp pilus assembly complex ATPase component TadA [Oscillospiraceae bacterium]|nr:Flp pilus assembly complex ATPase component TadA [Oscillospiraceae bacterium]
MDERYNEIPTLFPESMRADVKLLLEDRGNRVEEIRLRVGAVPTWVAAGREAFVPCRGSPRCVTPLDLEELIRRASDYSTYAVQDQLRAGFLTLRGGHRLGVCGLAVSRGEELQSIREFQAVNLRLAGERLGCATELYDCLQQTPGSVLILGPPRAGKTTVLRDLVRLLSDRGGFRVGLLDERGEIAACRAGVPQLCVGSRTDVLTACSKQIGIELMLRSMSPDWIAVDEITALEDADAISRAVCCGVCFLATAHGNDPTDLRRRPVYRRLLELGAFDLLAVLRPNRSLYVERMKNESVETDSFWDDSYVLGMGGASRGAATSKNRAGFTGTSQCDGADDRGNSICGNSLRAAL